jgi:hypothetical protein
LDPITEGASLATAVLDTITNWFRAKAERCERTPVRAVVKHRPLGVILLFCLLVVGCGLPATLNSGRASDSRGASASPSPQQLSACASRRECPSPRITRGMAFDQDRQTLVVFGGFDRDGLLEDAWEWSALNGWKELHPANSPARRETGAMVYDQARHVVLMYGGIDTSRGTILCGAEVGNRLCSDDTWTWDGTDWRQLNPLIRPWPFFPTAAYDVASANVVLLALGSTTCAASVCTDQPGTDSTWVWDGSSWTRRSNSGNPMVGGDPVMTFDPASGHVLTFGGHSSGVLDTHPMWSWDGRTWTSIGVRSPLSDLGRAASADTTHHVVVAYQEPTQTPTGYGQTWTWNGSRWAHLTPAHEATVILSRLFDDPRSHRVLLVGVGLNHPADTWSCWTCTALRIWSWNGTDWKQLA